MLYMSLNRRWGLERTAERWFQRSRAVVTQLSRDLAHLRRLLSHLLCGSRYNNRCNFLCVKVAEHWMTARHVLSNHLGCFLFCFCREISWQSAAELWSEPHAELQDSETWCSTVSGGCCAGGGGASCCCATYCPGQFLPWRGDTNFRVQVMDLI